jgi:hypothetical protein
VGEQDAIRIPQTLRPLLEAADSAYDEWLESLGSFFEDSGGAAETRMSESLQAFVSGASDSGIDVVQVSQVLRRRFPDAVGWPFFESALSSDAPGVRDDDVDDLVEHLTVDAWGGVAIQRSCAGCSSGVPLDATYCAKCGAQVPAVSATELLPVLHGLASEVGRLRGRLREPAGLPRTNLLSANFLTRAFAVYGHLLVVSLIVTLPLYLLALVIGLLAR